MDPLHTLVGRVIRRSFVSHIAILGAAPASQTPNARGVPDQVRTM